MSLLCLSYILHYFGGSSVRDRGRMGVACGGDTGGHAQLAEVAGVAHPHVLPSCPRHPTGCQVDRERMRRASGTNNLCSKNTSITQC